jgi:hypothetical protein
MIIRLPVKGRLFIYIGAFLVEAFVLDGGFFLPPDQRYPHSWHGAPMMALLIGLIR